jgi:hypothetical protein
VLPVLPPLVSDPVWCAPPSAPVVGTLLVPVVGAAGELGAITRGVVTAPFDVTLPPALPGRPVAGAIWDALFGAFGLAAAPGVDWAKAAPDTSIVAAAAIRTFFTVNSPYVTWTFGPVLH